MLTCRGCGAQLNPTQPECPYCKTRNTVDFSVISASTTDLPVTDRLCPNCSLRMETVDIGEGNSFFVEHCVQCGGLFFDNGELHALLEQKVDSAIQINYSGLSRFMQEPLQSAMSIVYRKCPVCSDIMNREKFGERAGVVVNHCHSHGIWLESGELTRLFEWKKEGGEILDAKRRLEDEQRKLKAERDRIKYRATGSDASGSEASGLFEMKYTSHSSHSSTPTAADLLFEVASWLFKR